MNEISGMSYQTVFRLALVVCLLLGCSDDDPAKSKDAGTNSQGQEKDAGNSESDAAGFSA